MAASKTTKTVKLVGPEHVRMTLDVDGEKYEVKDGTVTPELPEGKVPESLYGFGFYHPKDEGQSVAEKTK